MNTMTGSRAQLHTETLCGPDRRSPLGPRRLVPTGWLCGGPAWLPALGRQHMSKNRKVLCFMFEGTNIISVTRTGNALSGDSKCS